MIFGLFGQDKKRVAEMIAAARTGDTEKVKQLLSKVSVIAALDWPSLTAVSTLTQGSEI